MTSIEIVSEDQSVETVWDAAWAIEHGIDELRETYAQVALALDRVRAVAAGSAHPLPARALTGWADALELTGQAKGWLTGGIDELRRVSGVEPIGTVSDVMAVLGAAIDGVRRATGRLVQIRQRVETAAAQLTGDGSVGAPDPAIVGALDRWRRGLGVLDELTARMQHGVAALSAYQGRFSGFDPLPPRRKRLAGLLARTRHPAESVGIGAELAGRLVRQAANRRQEPPVPAHLRVPGWRRASWMAGPALRPLTGRRTMRGRCDAAFYDRCLRALLSLGEGDTHRYAGQVTLLRRATMLNGYAEALTAAFILAVERRFTPVSESACLEPATVRWFVARLAGRYDGDSGEVEPAVAERLIRAALGGPLPKTGDTVTLTILLTLMLVDLLADERLTGAERAGFRAEAVELVLSVAPDRLPAAADDRTERECGG